VLRFALVSVRCPGDGFEFGAPKTFFDDSTNGKKSFLNLHREVHKAQKVVADAIGRRSGY
jgi:hypothetical protein